MGKIEETELQKCLRMRDELFTCYGNMFTEGAAEICEYLLKRAAELEAKDKMN